LPQQLLPLIFQMLLKLMKVAQPTLTCRGTLN